MPDILQYVEAGYTKIGQRVKFPGMKAWWLVKERQKKPDGIWTVVKRGKSYKYLSKGAKLLQEPFANFNRS